MRVRLACTLATILLGSFAATASADLPAFSSSTIVPGISIGGMKLGQAGADGLAAWGGMARATECGSDGCIWTSSTTTDNDLKGRTRFNFRAGVVTFITLEAPEGPDRIPHYTGALIKLRTSKGVGLGTRQAALKKAYPKLTKLTNVSALTYSLKGAGKAKTHFAIVAGRVSDIYLTVY